MRLRSMQYKSILILTIILSMVIVQFSFAAQDYIKPNFDESFLLMSDFGVLSIVSGGIGNDLIQANIGPDGRFNFGIKKATSEDWYNIIYRWPATPSTSFTTIRIDGHNYVYGSSSGSFIKEPTNNTQALNESIWRVQDILVTQIIEASINPATGQADAMKINYTLTNTSSVSKEVGLRIMLDTMLNGNDSAPFRIPSSNGLEAVNYEKEYIGIDVPDFWQAFYNLIDPDISAQYTMRGGFATPPDRIAIANWGNIYNTLWDYIITSNTPTGDSAVGMWWNPQTLAPGQSKTIVNYYGRPGVGGTNTIVISGAKTIPYSEWSSNPFTLAVYFNNNFGRNLENVSLCIESDLTLANDDPTRTFGNITQNNSSQASWLLQPTQAGIYNIRILAYEGDTLLAEASYEVEALPPDTIKSTYEFLYTIPSNIEPNRDVTIDVTFRTRVLREEGYSDVYFEFESIGPGDTTFVAEDSNGTLHTFTNSGNWGYPGFNIPADYSATTPFTLNFSAAGNYTVTFKLVDCEGEIVDRIQRTQNITVASPYVPPYIPAPIIPIQPIVPPTQNLPNGAIIDRMPNYVSLSQPVQITELREEIVLEYSPKPGRFGLSARVYHWNPDINKWVALATYKGEENKAIGLNSRNKTGWFVVFGVYEPLFTDVTGHYAEDVVNLMNGLGVIEGSVVKGKYNTRLANLDLNVTRNQLVTFVYRVLNLNIDSPIMNVSDEQIHTILSNSYTDYGSIPDWARIPVASALDYGILPFDGDEFNGNTPISRLEAAIIISRALKIVKDFELADFSSFNDAGAISDFAKSEIVEGIIIGSSDGKALLDSNLTRAQALTMLYRLFTKAFDW